MSITITQQPVSASYPLGAPAGNLVTMATSTAGAITYQWYANGTAITGATKNYYLPSTASISTTAYYVIVSDGEDSAQSDSATVTVTGPVPQFETRLVSAAYAKGTPAAELNGEATVYVGEVAYQWYSGGSEILGAVDATFTPPTSSSGSIEYYVVASTVYNGETYSAQSNTATITVVSATSSQEQRFQQYLATLTTDFVKLAKLDFLNPDGNVAFTLNNDPLNQRAGAFLAGGTISCNLQNGSRRQADVTLSNLDSAYSYAVNNIWFGQQIRLSEGLVLPDGTDYYISQGIFEITNPEEILRPAESTVTYHLTDKWANLDGTLLGNLEGPYCVKAGTNILQAMASLLTLDKFTMANNGSNPIDPVLPLLTEYYNGKLQTLTDGSQVPLVNAPYDFLSDGDGALSDVLTGLADMLAAWIGYNSVGRLVVDPSQDDVDDSSKPILWAFTPEAKQFLGVSYCIQNSDVFNDIIVTGATNDTGTTARARVQNQDPSSDTCVSRIGMKTKRISMPNYYSDDVCAAYAEWKLKRYTVLTKSVTISCSQLFHIVENGIVTIQRFDKPGSPIERHVVQGFSRPIAQTGEMTINAISTADFPLATIITGS